MAKISPIPSPTVTGFIMAFMEPTLTSHVAESNSANTSISRHHIGYLKGRHGSWTRNLPAPRISRTEGQTKFEGSVLIEQILSK